MQLSLTRRSLMLLSAAMAATAAGADTTTPAPAATATATPAAPATEKIADYGIGDVGAKIQMAEYLSLTCPHCEHFHAEIYPKLKADYIDTGKLRLTIHEVYFDQLGLLAAMVARCGGEMRYIGIVDMLYAQQRDWAAVDTIDAAVVVLKKIARVAGLADTDVDTCLHDQKSAEALVAHYQSSIATAYPNNSFKGTPSFIINGKPNTDMNANMAYGDLQKILDAELAK